MNKNKKILASLFVVLLFSFSAFAGDPPPDPGGDPTGTGGGTPIGGHNAPIGSGLAVFLAMGLAYASAKTYQLYRLQE